VGLLKKHMTPLRSEAAKPQQAIRGTLVGGGITLTVQEWSSGQRLRSFYMCCFVMCAGILLTGCASEEPADLVGTYIGSYANGATEVFVIREDGTYFQRLSRSGQLVYENSGTWTLDGRIVDFWDVMIGFQQKDPPEFEPRRSGVLTAAWHPASGRIVVSLYSELRKQKPEEPTEERRKQ